jgi:hypothetical protein
MMTTKNVADITDRNNVIIVKVLRNRSRNLKFPVTSKREAETDALGKSRSKRGQGASVIKE